MWACARSSWIDSSPDMNALIEWAGLGARAEADSEFNARPPTQRSDSARPSGAAQPPGGQACVGLCAPADHHAQEDDRQPVR